MTAPVLQIIIGSTRPGRVGPKIAAWFTAQAELHGGFTVELVDLADMALPLFDEPNHPRMGQYTHEHTKKWAATIDRADALVFVIPEYNHSVNGATKNAIDFLYNEWQHKPVAFVSYGGIAAGIRAVQALKPVVAALKMVPIVDAVTIPMFFQFLTEDGSFVPDEATNAAAQATLTELARWTPALKAMRSSES